MRVIEARNVHEALPKAIDLLMTSGKRRDSRNGPVLQMDTPVATVYQRPMERVLFWEERDANPFLHLYESLWMLQGRNDVKPLTRYAKRFESFSDDGDTLHGAYGYRWRQQFWKNTRDTADQLRLIIEALKKNPEDRRQVLQMWDAVLDLGRDGKDLPCNLMATFQVNPHGLLDMAVFNRSNDIVWGAYGANAVHFAFLHEYVSLLTGYPPGTYTQISVNWHGYLNTLDQVRDIPHRVFNQPYSIPNYIQQPYSNNEVFFITMGSADVLKPISQEDLDKQISLVTLSADKGFDLSSEEAYAWLTPGLYLFHEVLRAHWTYSAYEKPDAYTRALNVLRPLPANNDWVTAAREWIQRRQKKWETAENKKTGPQAEFYPGPRTRPQWDENKPKLRRELLCPNCGNKDEDIVVDEHGPVAACSAECGYAMRVVRVELADQKQA